MAQIIFAIISFQAAYYDMSHFRDFFCFFFSFSRWGKWCSKSLHKFKFKSSISSSDAPPLHGLETCQHALLALFTILWAQHACSDTPYNAASTLDGGEKDACLYLFRYCSYPSIHSVLLLRAKRDGDHLMVVTHLIMLQTTLILWIQCLKRFSKICSEEN